jgi:hypothetical protein
MLSASCRREGAGSLVWAATWGWPVSKTSRKTATATLRMAASVLPPIGYLLA